MPLYEPRRPTPPGNYFLFAVLNRPRTPPQIPLDERISLKALLENRRSVVFCQLFS
jgi:hypothetical protein